MIEMAKEKVLAVADEILPLLQLNNEESGIAPYPLDVDWGRYVALEEMGRCHVFTVRQEGRLIGYSVFVTDMHPDYQVEFAYNRTLYLLPEYRRGTAVMHIVDYCEKALKDMGYKGLAWAVKTGHDWSPLLYRREYQDFDKIVGKYF